MVIYRNSQTKGLMSDKSCGTIPSFPQYPYLYCGFSFVDDM